MEVEHRSPDFRIEILRPSFDLMLSSSFKESCQTIATLYPTYTLSVGDIRTNPITGYSFSEAINTVEAPFSISLVAEGDAPKERRTKVAGSGETWFERVVPFDFVYIYEWKELRYIGVVHDIELNGSMMGGARTVTISGNSVGQVLSSFKFIIDTFIYGQSTLSGIALDKLQSDIALQQDKGAPVGDLIRTLYKGWFDGMMDATGEIGVTYLGIRSIMDAVLDLNTACAKGMTVLFPVVTSLWREGENNFWDILQRLAPPPLFEVFGRASPAGRYEIVVRETPFTLGPGQSWAALHKTPVPMYYVTSYSLRRTDSSVFSFFVAYVSNAGYGAHDVMLMSAEVGGKIGSSTSPMVDMDKWKKYGYRPLMVDLNYYNRDKDTSSVANSDMQTLLAELSGRLRDWYGNTDALIAGNITMMTMKSGENPRAGEKIEFGGVEFYVEEAAHSWQYLGPMQTRLRLSRGGDYKNGAATNYAEVARSQFALAARLREEAREAAEAKKVSDEERRMKRLGLRVPQ